MTQLPTLPEWLLACIAGDEATARALQDAYDRDLVRPPASCVNHQALIIPGRLLAECEAKRGVVAEWMDVHGPAEDGFDCNCDPAKGGDGNLYEWHYGHADGASKALRLLAVPYADRPGYRDEWRP